MNQNALALLNQITDKVKGSSEALRQKVVDELASQQIADRAKLLVSALDRAKELERETRKLEKPDITQFDAEGKEVNMFSKSAVEAKKKHQEKVEKFDKAFDKAFNGEDFEPLKQIMAQKAEPQG